MRVGEIQHAERHFSQALSEAPEPSDKRDANMLGALIVTEARLKLRQGLLDEAMGQFHKVRKLFQQFGLEREQVVVTGDIADILQSRGDLDEALRIRTEEQLPVLERLGDVREIAATLNRLFILYWQREEHQKAYEAIQRAFDIVTRLGIPDGISVVGMQLGQVLIAAGHHEDAKTVLTLSHNAYAKLGQAEGAQAVEALLARLNAS